MKQTFHTGWCTRTALRGPTGRYLGQSTVVINTLSRRTLLLPLEPGCAHRKRRVRGPSVAQLPGHKERTLLARGFGALAVLHKMANDCSQHRWSFPCDVLE